MQAENEKNLWVELKLLQTVVDKFDDISFRIKNWFFSILAAITGYAVVDQSLSLLIFNFGVIVLFYFYEATYRISQREFLERLREVQKLLRNGIDPSDDERDPYLDKYLFQGLDDIPEGRAYAIQRFFKVPEEKAKRNHKDWNLVFIECGRLIFQVRVSLPYIIVIALNCLIILWLLLK